MDISIKVYRYTLHGGNPYHATHNSNSPWLDEMKPKYLVISPFAAFLISLLFSVSIVQVKTQILTETRKSAIVNMFSENQLESGSFVTFWFPNGTIVEGHPYFVAEELIILKTLGALEAIDVEKAVNYIVSKQNITIGNTTIWGWPGKRANKYFGDPYVVFIILTALKSVNALDKVNRTALIDFALSRYDASTGAFKEPIITIEWPNGVVENFTACSFPLEFYASSDVAYAEPNMISTFLGVTILAQLNALDKINLTKTIEWILSCKAENGAFKPFPKSHPEYLPPWSSLRTNPFYVDRYGTGLAYTYAAISTLNTLGLLEGDIIDKGKVKDYVLSCVEPLLRGAILFKAHPDDRRITVGVHRQYTYYAVKTLKNIGMFEESKHTLAKASKYILTEQNLRFDDSWPVPNRRKESFYGLFLGTFTPHDAALYAVSILNETESLYLLNELTPAALKTWQNLVIFSVIVSIVSFVGIMVSAGISAHKRLQVKEIENEAKSTNSTRGA